MTHTKWVLIDKNEGKLLRDNQGRPELYNTRREARAAQRYPWFTRVGKAEIIVKSGFVTSN